MTFRGKKMCNYNFFQFFLEYYEVVAQSLARFDKHCFADVKEAFDTIQLFLSYIDGPSLLKSLFKYK